MIVTVIVFMIHQYSFNLLTYNNSLNPYNNARQYVISFHCTAHRCSKLRHIKIKLECPQLYSWRVKNGLTCLTLVQNKPPCSCSLNDSQTPFSPAFTFVML